MTTTINASMGAREWAMLVALSVLWGGSFFFVGVAVHDLPPLTIVTLRVGGAALTLWAVVRLLGLPVPASSRAWLAFLAMGVLNNAVPFTLIVWGQTQIASGLASILNATAPLFSVLVAGLLLADERVTTARVAGMGVGFAGVLVVVGPDALGGLGTQALAQLAVLGAGLSYAFAAVFGRRFRAMGVDPVVVAAGQVTASTVLLAPLAIALEQPFSLATPGAATWACIAGLAVLSTALAYVLYFRILATAGATNLLLTAFLIPVSAIALGSLVLGERLAPMHFAGMALIGAGLCVIDGRPYRHWRRRSVPRPPAGPVHGPVEG